MEDGNREWINASLVEEILQIADEDESIRVSNVSVKPTTSLGHGFSSDMYCVAVKFSTIDEEGRETRKDYSLLVKLIPEIGLSADYIDMIAGARLFAEEISVMLNILPKMNEIIKSLGVTLFARTFHAQIEKPIYIVMEDMSTKGYRVAGHKVGLDLVHSLMAIRALAKYHASSVALAEKEPGIFDSHNCGRFPKYLPDSERSLYFHSTRCLANVTESWPEFDQKITEKLRKSADSAGPEMWKSSDVGEEEFKVLNHGDYWMNNILYRYDDADKPSELVVVDFQYPYYGSPAHDVLFFLSTSLSESVRDNYRELLLREYHFEFGKTIRELNCTTIPPSFDEFTEDLDKRFWVEALSTLFVWPSIALGKLDFETLNKMVYRTDERCVSVPGMLSNRFRGVATKILLRLDHLGLLDA